MELIPWWVATLSVFLMTAWAWVPIVFAAFALGRRQFTLKQLFIFIAVESLALGGFLFYRAM